MAKKLFIFLTLGCLMAGMAHAQTLNIKPAAQSCTHLLYNLKGSPLERFVDVEYFAFYGVEHIMFFRQLMTTCPLILY